MNKFSKMTGQKVSESPKLVSNKEEIELSAIKAGINKLISNHLVIRSYGSARRNILESTVKIAGQDEFIDALIDFMNDKSLTDQIKMLEGLKSETQDWRSIDHKINEINSTINDNHQFNLNINKVDKIKTLLETYADDDRFDIILDNYVMRVNNADEANTMGFVANKMLSVFKFQDYSKDKLRLVSKKFFERSNQLGYQNDNSRD